MSDASVRSAVDHLQNLSLTELRAEWHRWHPDRRMPHRLPRDLLVRTIAWRLQEKEVRPFPARLVRELERLSNQLRRSGSLDIEREARLKIGTVLVREWHGETHRVTALNDGFLYNGRTYISLSEIARAITGTRWSGPRFFGLKAGKARSPERGGQNA